jgi:hypothetical protein
MIPEIIQEVSEGEGEFENSQIGDNDLASSDYHIK